MCIRGQSNARHTGVQCVHVCDGHRSVCVCVCLLTEVPVKVTGGDCQEILKLLLEGVKPVELVEGMVTGAVACGGVTVTLIQSLYGPGIMTGLLYIKL